MIGTRQNSMNQEELPVALARLLIARLERLSADSIWAHRASGSRGALIKLVEEIESGTSPCREANLRQLEYLVEFGFDLLEKAAREMIE